ncbi:MAG: branched-chain amino acid ABC transporter permease [Clostridiales bacterium]|nr:branched-chain amino acid ABC transporter permease [Candidatus Equinaster intestinalis]
MSLIKNIKETFKWKYQINYIGVAAFLILMIVLSETGNLTRSVAGLLVRIAYSIILAVSLNLVVGFLGELSLGHAGFMCVGAYLGCYAANYLTPILNNPILTLIAAMFIGGITAAIFGLIIGLPALRLKGDYLAIVTLAFGEIVRNVFKNLPMFGGAKGLITSDIQMNSKELFIIAFIVVLVVLFLTQNLIRSKHGRAITAIRDNEIAAKAMGVNVTFYKLFVFTVSAFFAGMAGVIYGHFANPVLYGTFSYNYSIEILVMVVLGGMGSINGSILAAALITYINFKLQSELTGDLAALKLLIYALILIVVVVFGNAPALAPLKEKLSIRNFKNKIFKRDKHPEVVSDDAADWNKIKTKINMDEVLSTDLSVQDDVYPENFEEGK